MAEAVRNAPSVKEQAQQARDKAEEKEQQTRPDGQDGTVQQPSGPRRPVR
jgi:hypothetical protein